MGKGINLAVPPGDSAERATFLGCDNVRSTKVIKGKVLQCLTWDATAGIRRGIAKYIAAVESVCPGWTPRIYDSHVPLRHIDTKTSIHRRPEVLHDFVECPNCMDTFDKEFIRKHHTFPAGTQRKVTDVFRKTERVNHLIPCTDGTADPMPEVSMSSRHCKNVGGFRTGLTSYKAIEHWALPFIADQINLDALDTTNRRVYKPTRSGAVP